MQVPPAEPMKQRIFPSEDPRQPLASLVVSLDIRHFFTLIIPVFQDPSGSTLVGMGEKRLSNG